MIVTVAGGKGGAGKTTVAVNLAVTAARRGRRVTLLDADVEAPNAGFFLEPELGDVTPVTVPVPTVDESLCSRCGTCAETCRFGAILLLDGRPLLFRELCHACGGCVRSCPTGAISEVQRAIGSVTLGTADGLVFVEGRLTVGEPRAVPVVQALKAHARPGALVLVDGPPGTGCPAQEAMRGSDFVCIVGDPTPFGLHDLRLTIEAVDALGLEFGVVLNRTGVDGGRRQDLVQDRPLDVMVEIPEDRRVAEAVSRGERVVDAVPGYRDCFERLLDQIEGRVRSIRTARPI